MTTRNNIVAAELLSVKDKVSLIDAIAFPLAGNHIAGWAGAFVGSALVPSKLVYNWRVLYEDGTYGKLKLKGTDPRNQLLMDLPYIPDYEEHAERNTNMFENVSAPTQKPYGVPTSDAVVTPQSAQTTPSAYPQANDGGAVIGAGYYEFGANFPEGIFNMEYLTGEGILQLKDRDGWTTDMNFGSEDSARGFSGLSSSEYASFKLEGSVQLRVTRATMIQV